MVETEVTEVTEVTELPNFDNEYVYDIGINHHSHKWFFANDILIHNSAYFSAWEIIKDDVESGKIKWNVDTAVALYDNLAEQVNESFPGFMKKAFYCPEKYGNLIKCGREVVGSTGLFITKKRYAIMVVDNEGKRLDTNDKPGKIKAMGLDLKRSDTPVIVQNFLKDILESTLTNKGKEEVIQQILDFKEKFKMLPPWEMGAPKRINKLSFYTQEEKLARSKSNKRARLPGHVRAGMNYNFLRDKFKDNETLKINDGMKAIICKLTDNHYGFTSIARPTDENNIPEWFKELPFDVEGMAETQIDKKVDNLLGALGWELDISTDTSSTFKNLFDF